MSGRDAVSELLLYAFCSAMESTRDCKEMCRDLYIELWVESKLLLGSSRPSTGVLASSKEVDGSGEEYMAAVSAANVCQTVVQAKSSGSGVMKWH